MLPLNLREHVFGMEISLEYMLIRTNSLGFRKIRFEQLKYRSNRMPKLQYVD